MAFKFPKEVLVVREKPANDDPYLAVVGDRDVPFNDDGTRVAVYELKEVRVLKIKTKLVKE